MSIALPVRKASGPLELSRMPDPPRLTPAHAAASVMTDFTATAVYCTDVDVAIDQALGFMKSVGVRFLFVKEGSGELVGLVTSTDILGEKPLRHLQSQDCTLASCSRDDVLVRHVMVPTAQWEVIEYADVEKARVAQVVETFKAKGRRHLLVTEGGRVRGMFSATRVEQALGIRLDIVRMAESFAEIENAVIHAA